MASRRAPFVFVYILLAENREGFIMSNRLFQGIIHQMRETIDRVTGVIDENGVIIACSELVKIGEMRQGVRDELAYTADAITSGGYTYRPIGTGTKWEYIVFVEGEDNSLLDVLVNSDSPNADRGLVNESLNKEIERALSTLATREREIIKSFFGIGCQEMTLEEIGERFGLTRERVRQIKEKAIRKLKNSQRSKLLKSYLG